MVSKNRQIGIEIEQIQSSVPYSSSIKKESAIQELQAEQEEDLDKFEDVDKQEYIGGKDQDHAEIELQNGRLQQIVGMNGTMPGRTSYQSQPEELQATPGKSSSIVFKNQV